ncbi:type 1 fimbria pilin [Luteibacter sp. Sphag1AF]|uniref:fimbrial protein n=1 Tax=Luteibacter sp. Sphag1AF TaxID=2587031 RepID=UPI00162138FA|nr:fimbrial protein [Luteibacter sp. Sphag1AF]MBB3226570.1 type 1 fimbria pilin [Luteibacter sp. Sphag1AF]
MKAWMGVVIVTTGWMVTLSARASCDDYPVQGQPQQLTFTTQTPPMTLNVGEVIAQGESSPSYRVSFWCRFPQSAFRPVTYAAPTAAGANIFATEVPGVGIRIYVGGDNTPWDVLPFSKSQSGALWAVYKNARYRVQLIKTGDIRSGTIAGGIVGNGGVDGIDQLSVRLAPVRIEAPLPTCTFLSASLAFPLGVVDLEDIAREGHSHWVDGRLAAGGCQHVNQVNMRFEAQKDAANPALFAATGGSGGVGIELRSVRPDAPADPSGATPIVFTPRDAGQTYDFRARYVRDGLPLKSGPGNASITVRVSYD